MNGRTGGKIEGGETPEEVLKREIRAELSTEICVDEFVKIVEYDYSVFHLTTHSYLSSLLKDAMHLNKHDTAWRLKIDELGSVKWLIADLEVIEKQKR